MSSTRSAPSCSKSSRWGRTIPGASWRDTSSRTLFPRHPYGRPIIGFPDTLAGDDGPTDMRDYYRPLLSPGERHARRSPATSRAAKRSQREVRAHGSGSSPRGPSFRLGGLLPAWDSRRRRGRGASRRAGTTRRSRHDHGLAHGFGRDGRRLRARHRAGRCSPSGRMSRLQRRLVYDDRTGLQHLRRATTRASSREPSGSSRSAAQGVEPVRARARRSTKSSRASATEEGRRPSELRRARGA